MWRSSGSTLSPSWITELPLSNIESSNYVLQVHVFTVLFFESLHTLCDLSWGKEHCSTCKQSLAFWLSSLFTTIDQYKVCIAAEAVPICLGDTGKCYASQTLSTKLLH